ncbi:MAG: LamG-like jellyroll fold domain-containing protein, partial [Planctomycetaceae bacterium]
GLYHFGNRAIVAYTVGETPVLEMPGAERVGETTVFTRAFNIGPRATAMILQVAKHGGKASQLTPVEGTQRVVVFGPKRGESPKPASTRLTFDGATYLSVARANDFNLTDRDYTIVARIRTRKGGTIFAKTPKGDTWGRDGKALFVRGGRLTFDIGWVGAVSSRRRVNDGRWHDVAMTWDAKTGQVRLFVDGKADASRRLAPKKPVKSHEVRIGLTAANFPRGQSFFDGDIAEVWFYQRRLVAKELSVTRRVVPKGRPIVARRFIAGAPVPLRHDSPEGATEGFSRPSGTQFFRSAPQPASELAGYSQVSLRDEPSTRTAKPAGNLIGHWKLQSVTTDSVSDATGNKHVATIRRGKTPAVGTGSLVAGLSRPVTGAKWLTDGNGNLRLRIPAGKLPLRFTIAVSHAPTTGQQSALTRHLRKPRNTIDLSALTHGGPPRWPQTLTTKTAVMTNGGPFEVDVFTRPAANPWSCRVRFTGLDFHPDGKRLAVCTWDGDVWMVGGIDKPSAGLKWQRIASGLFQPLGLKFVKDKIYLTCRDQLVILHDLNGDGETDFYENFNNDHQVTEHFHEFAMGLQTDAEGNFYYAKSARHALPAIVPHHGTLLKVSKDGLKTEIIANGFRAANGVCVNPDGTFFVTDQEGHWTPKNRINWVKPGGFYGNMLGYHDVKSSADDAMEQPVCWITNKFDRSPAELLWVKDAKWGPLNGSLLSTSYGYGKVFVVLRQKVGKQLQGGMVELPLPRIPTGLIRGRFRPKDGQLYACGMFAWAGSAQQPGGLYRIRYTGRPMHVPTGLKATPGRIAIRFTGTLDADAAKDPANYKVKVWDLKRTKNYGSKHYNEHPLKVTAVTVSKDRKTVELTIPDLKPTRGMEIKYTIK